MFLSILWIAVVDIVFCLSQIYFPSNCIKFQHFFFIIIQKQQCNCSYKLFPYCFYKFLDRQWILYFVHSRFVYQTLKISKISLFYWGGPWDHLDWHGLTHSSVKALKVPFQVKMTKMPLVNLGLTEGQNWSKPHQNNIFHVFTSNLRLSKIFVYFDQV